MDQIYQLLSQLTTSLFRVYFPIMVTLEPWTWTIQIQLMSLSTFQLLLITSVLVISNLTAGFLAFNKQTTPFHANHHRECQMLIMCPAPLLPSSQLEVPAVSAVWTPFLYCFRPTITMKHFKSSIQGTIIVQFSINSFLMYGRDITW